MFTKKDKASLSIKSIESPGLNIVDLSIHGPSNAVLAAFTALLSGAATVTAACPGPTEAPEELPPSAVVKPPSPPRLVEPYEP